jgi:outer membrane protein assembly factor BamA
LTTEQEGNQVILDSIHTKKRYDDFKSLNAAVDSVYKRLLYKGFIDAFYSKPNRISDSSYQSHFTLGPRVKEVRVFLNAQIPTDFPQTFNLEVINDTLIVPIEHLERTLTSLNQLFVVQGDPFSKLQLINIEKLKTDVMSADLSIRTNRVRTIDKIVVKGYEKFPKSYLRHYLRIKEGAVFNLEKLNKKTQDLSNLIFANQVREPEVLFTKDSTTLYLYLEKNPSNNFDGFLGFGTNEENNKLELDGYLNLQLINNLNFGETLFISYKSDEIDQQIFNIRLETPYLFKSPIGAEIGLHNFRKDSTFVTTTQYLHLNYQINSKHQISAGLSGVNSNNLLDNDSSILQDYRSFFYTSSYSFIDPQYYDRLFPVNCLIDFSFGLGSRDSDSENLNQTKIELNSYKIFNLNKRNSIFLGVQGAALVSDSYLDNELFRFGGINSIRGIEENSLVANLYGVLNTEYRYRLSSNLYINSVLDAAYFENQITSLQEKIFGFGLGFGLLTEAGLFRFNYASAKVEDQPFQLANSKVHISLTARF